MGGFQLGETPVSLGMTYGCVKRIVDIEIMRQSHR